jgi:hypothetical protein
MWLLLLLQLWHSTTLADGRNVVLAGTWQSCRDVDGTYAERVYEQRVNGVFQWEFHMGPYHEFAFYRIPQPDEHDHTDSGNLLHTDPNSTDDYQARPSVLNSFRVLGEWVLPHDHLKITVVAAGGSLDLCEAFVIRIAKTQ